jgi:uncharacterized protein DUF11
MVPRLLLIVVLLYAAGVSRAQEPQNSPPRTELLTMNGGKPNLSAAGEGIISFKNDEIYKKGKMTVRLLKPAEVPFKLEFPPGYSLYNDLIYVIETDIVAAGPSDITFNLPSARTKETFRQLRILYPQVDFADPKVPRWTDITLDADSPDAQQWLSETAVKQRLPDFKTRTLHAFTEATAVCYLVALRDPAKERHKLTADLQLSGNAPTHVTEGESVTYELKITNAGPETATGIRLHADPSFSFVSVEASDGKCNMSAQNVYCKIPTLEKGRSVDIKIVERCEWNRHFPNGPPGYENPTSVVSKNITVGSTERDPSFADNELRLSTEVFPDQNKGPVIEVISPTLFQMFSGPAASVPIRFKASDPDGFVKKVELFDDDGKRLGEAIMVSDGEYELIYKDAGLGRRSVTIVVTDNLGRVAYGDVPEFFINGPAKIEIISPKAGSTLNRIDGDVTITIHASSPSSSIKKVSLGVWDAEAKPIGNDNFVVNVKSCPRKCRLQATAVDDQGIETRSEYVEFRITSAPTTGLAWFDGEYLRDFEPGKVVKANELILVGSADYENQIYAAEVAKVEIFVDGRLVCTDTEPGKPNSGFECVWKPAPGRYKLQAVATDVDGAVGKSEVIEVVIERP